MSQPALHTTEANVELPEFAWADLFPNASLELIVNPSRAVKVLDDMAQNLWTNALIEGDAVLGFDLEWKPNRKGV